ncbi:hypothetical protein F2P81_022940 [Scophthalmus maximus]|uniref:Uncharacterized protein n=1 Tax=Scophthalmus maximus TaxID=52904 RepID=A0A6A4RW43_SCOMX|nr:hypothetical protein F2P81_022940 [Scophthalmus maximus]
MKTERLTGATENKTPGGGKEINNIFPQGNLERCQPSHVDKLRSIQTQTFPIDSENKFDHRETHPHFLHHNWFRGKSATSWESGSSNIEDASCR